jgi:hypothetical protein
VIKPVLTPIKAGCQIVEIGPHLLVADGTPVQHRSLQRLDLSSGSPTFR